jgi:hypothetical protein
VVDIVSLCLVRDLICTAASLHGTSLKYCNKADVQQ